MEVEVTPSLAEIDPDEWNALVGDEAAPFLRWEWLASLEDAGCTGERTGWFPCHALMRERGRLVCVIPMYLKTNSDGEFVYDWSWADAATQLGERYYPKLVVGVPFTPASGQRVLTADGQDRHAILRAVPGVVERLAAELDAQGTHILFCTEPECRAFVGQGYLERHGLQYHFVRGDLGSFDDFIASMPSKKRTKLRREVRAIRDGGITIRTVEPGEIDASLTRDMFAFYASTIDRFYWGKQYLNERFFELVAKRMPESLRWVVAERDGTRIAGAFNVRGPKRLYGRYWGARVEVPFLHFAVCYYHGIEECIASDLKAFEPGAGGEHKRARGFLPVVTYSAHRLRSSVLTRVLEPYLEREREAIAHARREMLRGERPRSD